MLSSVTDIAYWVVSPIESGQLDKEEDCGQGFREKERMDVFKYC